MRQEEFSLARVERLRRAGWAAGDLRGRSGRTLLRSQVGPAVPADAARPAQPALRSVAPRGWLATLRRSVRSAAQLSPPVGVTTFGAVISLAFLASSRNSLRCPPG